MNLPPPVAAASAFADPVQSAAPVDPAPLTAKALLFETAADADAALQRHEEEATNAAVRGSFDKFSKVTRKVAEREVRKAILDLLDIDLVGVVQRGWARHDALIAAGRRTAEGGREIVSLADHTVSSTHTPHIKLALDGLDLGTITIAVVMSLKLIGITGVVERGQLVAVETGSVAATAKLSVEDVPITTRSQTIDAVVAMRLAKPLPLITPTSDLPPPVAG